VNLNPWQALALALTLWLVYWGSLKIFGLAITYLVHGNFNAELTGAMWFAPIVAAHPFSMAVAWLAITGWGKRPFLKTVGIDWGALRRRFGDERGDLRRRVIMRSMVVGLGMWTLSAWVHVTSLDGGTRFSELPGNSLESRLAEAVLATFSAPIVEEIFYRGILYPKLERVTGVPSAVVIVSTAFAVTHMHQNSTAAGAISWSSVGIIFVHGLALALARWWTGSIIPGIIMHGVSNGLNTILVKLIMEPLLSPK
jgi:membrane protease YdiL (CAAX protease family)